ncbi:MAG: hypothetical protein HUJ65_05565, partial [Oscillospiraceae bacterium]|nr:hypothetical protein [Oscillospiraceae bacterium]
ITGDRSYTFGYRDDVKHITGAVDDILHYYRVPTPELPDNISGFENVLDYQLRPYGIMRRSVKLTGKWYRDAYGPMLCRMQDGTYSAAIPCAASGYRFTNSRTGLCERITRKNADLFTEDAICFYKGFPNKALTTKDLFSFILHTISLGDFIFLAAAALLVTLVGTLSAYANNIIFGQVINSGRLSLLVSVLVLLIGVTVSTALIRAAKLLISDRLSAKTHLHVESATMMRILSLPASFFKQYNSGDLSTRVQYMTIICDTLVEIVLTSGISALFAFIYVAQIVNYAPSLALPAVITVLAACLTTTIGVIMHIKRTDRLTAARAKERGIVFSIITGIQKIKLTGAEKRTFSKWARLYRDVLKNMYAPQFINELMVVIFAVGTAVIYLCAA